MSAAELIQHVGSLGFRLEPRPGDGLAVRPASKLPAELADKLRHRKTEIIRLLTADSVAPVPARKGWGVVPPLDLPLVALKPNPNMTQRELVISYQSRQCSNRQLREWLTNRKAAYYATIAKTWDCGLLAYAAARDAACWQLDRTEAEIWDLLEGIESCVEDVHTFSGQRLTPMTLEEWVDAQVADAPHLFESNAGGGAASNGAGGAAGVNRSVKNPFRKDTWNLTEQMKLQKTDPALAARLKAAA